MPDERTPYVNPDVEKAVQALERRFEDSLRQMEVYLNQQIGKLNTKGGILVHDADNVRDVRRLLDRLQLEVREAGFGSILDEQAQQLRNLADKIIAEGDRLGIGRDKFRPLTGENVKALIKNAHRELMATEVKISREVEDILARSTMGNVKWQDISARIHDRLDLKTQRQAITKTFDQVASFHTQVRVEHFEDRDEEGNIRGAEWFLYDGPLDERNRDFCARFVGTRVTMEILNEHATSYGRKHPLPPSVSLGGYNCRHDLVPLMTQEAQDRYPIGPRKGIISSTVPEKAA